MHYHDSRTTIIQLAREIAQSGRYRGWRTIEVHLRADSLPGVSDVLDDPDIRCELDGYCRGNARAS